MIVITVEENDIAIWCVAGTLDTKGFDYIEFNRKESPARVKQWIMANHFTEHDKKVIWAAYWQVVHHRLAPSAIEEAVWKELKKDASQEQRESEGYAPGTV